MAAVIVSPKLKRAGRLFLTETSFPASRGRVKPIAEQRQEAAYDRREGYEAERRQVLRALSGKVKNVIS